MKSDNPVVIVGIARTPLGAFQGGLSTLSASILGARAVEAALKDSRLNGEDIESIYMGCVLPAGQSQAPARQAALGANLSLSCEATTINKMCGSGMQSMIFAYNALLSNTANIVIAGGMESMTNAPYLIPNARAGLRMGNAKLIDHMFYDGLTDAYEGQLMGIYADLIAKQSQISRKDQDLYTIDSVKRARKAIEDGSFKREIVPVYVKTRKTETIIEQDEIPGNVHLEKISKLKPVFGKEGSVTAANASAISDGAAACVMMRRSEAEKRGIKPIAIMNAHAVHAHEPRYFTTAPVYAIEKLLNKLNWNKAEIDLYEINEAFAVVTLYAMKELHLSHEIINIHGGACALGHPIGATGARIAVTLLSAMEKNDLKRGVASLCIGGGEATAIAFERP